MTRHPFDWLVGLLLTLCLGVVATTTLAQTGDPPQWPARVGRLVTLQGTAWIFDRDEGSWIQAQNNRPVTGDDRIDTDSGSRVELRIGSTTLRLAGDTEVWLRRLDDQAIAVELGAGSLALRVTSNEMLSQVEVSTPEGRFMPRTTGHFRIDRVDEASDASAWRGTLEFVGRDSRLSISAGVHAQLWLQGGPATTHYRWLELVRDEFSEWAQTAERESERSQSARHVSTEMTGWEDLDRHGQWRSHPEFGSVWRPSAIAAGWEPYRDGRWVWVNPWGWTWFDAAPWGFAPFHYGHWVRWGGAWVWAPGKRVPRPAYAPAQVTWAFSAAIGAGLRPPPPLRWQPLAPHETFRPHVRPPWPREHVAPSRPPSTPPPRVDRRLPRPPGGHPAASVTISNPGRPGDVTVLPRDAFSRPPGQPQPPLQTDVQPNVPPRPEPHMPTRPRARPGDDAQPHRPPPTPPIGPGRPASRPGPVMGGGVLPAAPMPAAPAPAPRVAAERPSTSPPAAATEPPAPPRSRPGDAKPEPGSKPAPTTEPDRRKRIPESQKDSEDRERTPRNRQMQQ